MPIVVDAAVVNPPSPIEGESTDGVLHVWADFTYSGIRMRANFGAASTDHVRMFRLDGSPVRGSDPSVAVNSIAYGYDHEMSLGSAATYYAVAYNAADVEIARSTLVSIVVPAPVKPLDIWVKSIDDPSLSMVFSARIPAPEIADAGRLALVGAQGARYQSGAFDVRTPQPLELVLRLALVPDRARLARLLDSGHLFVQWHPSYGEEDFYALADSSSRRVFRTMTDPRRDTSVTFVPIDRPATIDSDPAIPGHSIADSYAAVPTISQASLLWSSIEDAAGF